MLHMEQRTERLIRTLTSSDRIPVWLSGLHIGKCVLDMSACPKQQSNANCLGPRNGAAEPAKDAVATMPLLQLEPVFSARCGPSPRWHHCNPGRGGVM